MVEVDSVKWQALGQGSRAPMAWVYRREARLLRQFEVRASSHAASVLVVNARERDALAAIAPGAPIVVVENGIDTEHFAAPGPPTDSPTLVFCRVMDYQPNVDGVIWFVEHVWPVVRRTLRDATFTVVGARPARSIAQLAEVPGVTVTGEVEDVRPYLWDAAVSVAPLRTARGLQNKVLKALAAGLPVLATRAVADGLPEPALQGCWIGDDPRDWVDSLLKLLAAPAVDRRRLSQRADLSRLDMGGPVEDRLADLPRCCEPPQSRCDDGTR
jgi:glycosyltransferase involved in cell wall biosynthesis